MNLYVRRALRNGAMGTVFHLLKKCAKAPGSMAIELTPDDVLHYRKVLGVRRICIRCRKAAGRKT